MQVEISPETEERLRALVERGSYRSLEDALEGVVAAQLQQEADDEAELTRRLDKSRLSAVASRHQILTAGLAAEIQSEGRARLSRS